VGKNVFLPQKLTELLRRSMLYCVYRWAAWQSY